MNIWLVLAICVTVLLFLGLAIPYYPASVSADSLAKFETGDNPEPESLASSPESGLIFATNRNQRTIIGMDGNPSSESYQQIIFRTADDTPGKIIYNPKNTNFYTSDLSQTNTLSAVSSSTGQVSRDIFIGPRWYFTEEVHNATPLFYNPENEKMYVRVAVQGWDGDGLVIIDSSTEMSIGPPIYLGPNPWTAALDRTTGLIYVLKGDGTIRILDGNGGSPTEHQLLPQVVASNVRPGPTFMAIGPNNHFLYLGYSGQYEYPWWKDANGNPVAAGQPGEAWYSTGTLFVLNHATGELLATSQLGLGRDHSIAFNPANGDAYVANCGLIARGQVGSGAPEDRLPSWPGTVTVISGSDYSHIGTIDLDSCPNDIVYNSKDQKFYLGTGEISGDFPNFVYKSLIEVIDPKGLPFGVTTVLHGKLLTTPEYWEIPIGGYLPPNVQVYDTAVFQLGGDQPIPTGKVTYYRYQNDNCAVDADNPSAVHQEEVNVRNDGSVPPSSVFVIRQPGAISYRALYSGDINYDRILSRCEPLNISPIFTSIRTEDGIDVTGGRIYVGTVIQDTATVPGLVGPIFDENRTRDTVTYVQYNNRHCQVDPDNPSGWTEQVEVNEDRSVPPSRTINMTTPGEFSFRAIYNSKYASPCEPVAVDPIQTATRIIKLGDIGLRNVLGSPISELEAGSQAILTIPLTNTATTGGEAIFMVQIQNNEGLTNHSFQQRINIGANETLETSLDWTPFTPGNYTVNASVLHGDVESALGDPRTTSIVVRAVSGNNATATNTNDTNVSLGNFSIARPRDGPISLETLYDPPDNQFLVVIKTPEEIGAENVLNAVAEVTELANAVGAKVSETYNISVTALGITAPDVESVATLMENLRGDDRILDVVLDFPIMLQAQDLPFHVERVDGEKSVASSGDNRGNVNADIAIIDSGVDRNHPDLNVFSHVSCLSDPCAPDPAIISDVSIKSHGTKVAGVAAAKDNNDGIVGIAPGARIWSVRVLPESGSQSDPNPLLRGLNYAIRHADEIDVINLSLGCDEVALAKCREAKPLIHKAISDAVSAGITVVVAAGNDGTNANRMVPANSPNAITVSAFHDFDGRCGGSDGLLNVYGINSNWGQVVDIAAPGALIRSTTLGGGYGTGTGTSLAAPSVSGAAAIAKEIRPNASPSIVRDMIMASEVNRDTGCDTSLRDGRGGFTGDMDRFPEAVNNVGQSMGYRSPSTNGGFLVQSAFGNRGSFELVVPSQREGFYFTWRDNDDSRLPWGKSLTGGAELVGASVGHIDAVSLIQSNFGIPQSAGNLEVFARAGDGIHHFWRISDLINSRFQWNGPGGLLDQNGSPILASGVSGNPVVIQTYMGKRGDFALAVPAASDGFYFTVRDNDDPRLPWGKGIPGGKQLVGTSVGHIDSLALIQSNFGHSKANGNLEVIARVGDRLYEFWRIYDAQTNTFQWKGPVELLNSNGVPILNSGVSGNPSMVQSSFGNRGSYELAVPAADRGFYFTWRDNDDSRLPWGIGIPGDVELVATGLGHIDSVSLIQSNFGTNNHSPANFEVIVSSGGGLYHFWRTSDMQNNRFQWNGPVQLLDENGRAILTSGVS